LRRLVLLSGSSERSTCRREAICRSLVASLHWGGKVPTVHLSLPDEVHQELKKAADEIGVRMTDLIKIFIREGLEKIRKERLERKRRAQQEATELLLQLMSQLEELKNAVEERLVSIEGDLYRLQVTVQSLKKRVSKLEDLVEEMRIPVEEPQIIRP